MKCAKSEVFPTDVIPHLQGLPAPRNSVNISAPGNGFVAPQQPVQGQVSPRAEAKMTLFHWQIEREERKLGGISPELLNIQDRDGDTYVLTQRVVDLDQEKVPSKVI